jgi:hypothetical protein
MRSSLSSKRMRTFRYLMYEIVDEQYIFSVRPLLFVGLIICLSEGAKF